jgi:hypothetical protein
MGALIWLARVVRSPPDVFARWPPLVSKAGQWEPSEPGSRATPPSDEAEKLVFEVTRSSVFIIPIT